MPSPPHNVYLDLAGRAAKRAAWRCRPESKSLPRSRRVITAPDACFAFTRAAQHDIEQHPRHQTSWVHECSGSFSLTRTSKPTANSPAHQRAGVVTTARFCSGH